MRWLSRAIAILLIPIGIASFYNVYADEAALESKAHAVACGARGPKCGARMSRQARMPWKRAYVFSGAGGGGDGRVQVDCTHALVLFGEYTCARAAGVSY